MAAPLQSPSGGTDRLKSLVHAGLRYADARAQLLQIEAQEAGQHVRSALLCVGLLIGSLVGAWLLILPACIYLASAHFQIPWHQLALGAGGLHLLVAVIALRRLWVRLGHTRLFEESIRQFQQDRAWLAGTPES
jgi:uncharacterized membrane protein YqjE